MTWRLSDVIDLRNDRVPDADADRQQRTAAEILRRFDDQPGVVLADEVGMGKTFVALAVAVSAVEATQRKRPIVVMVPQAVAEKWPKEWAVFADRCLPPDHGLRTAGPIWRGSEFLRFLDDPASRRKHLIFMSHGALTSSLQDPFVSLALLRQATARRPDLLARRRYIARYARRLVNDARFNEKMVVDLLERPPDQWRERWNKFNPKQQLGDDPVPHSFVKVLSKLELDGVREAVLAVPRNWSAGMEARLRRARKEVAAALGTAWSAALCKLNERLPLLILDEAHHVRNDTRLGRLFANEAESDAEALQPKGALGNMFERMLFLTATPFQLGHAELLRVLRRFEGVRWLSESSRADFTERMDGLNAALDRAQASALRLERAWGRLGPEHVSAVAAITSPAPLDDQPEPLRIALGVGQDAKIDLQKAELLLKPWVVRHLKSNKAERREYLPGRGILEEEPVVDGGLPVGGRATLPFLLAARAQAVASLEQTGQGATRAYFAYGLASSFEAYADTRRNRMAALDDQVDANVTKVEVPRYLKWYLDRIAAALPQETAEGWAEHPKVAATVKRVVDLWRNGEKSLIFCFYVETGRALRAHISRALESEIVTMAAAALKIDANDPDVVLEELGGASRLLRSDASGYDAFRKRVLTLASSLDGSTADQLAEIVIRFMRTPSFLVRFVDLSQRSSVEPLIEALERSDGSGLTLGRRIEAFADHVARLVPVERDALFAALEGIQTGAIGTLVDDFDPAERAHAREKLLPNVRLANGGVRAETRRRLMLTFNTPFFPEVLVASSVMAEGVDLHLDCRHVIHHDLDWNPSTLEQRTGRVDRIGSKSERAGVPLAVYEPYLAGTHDEKMFRVVKDRERWFGVVMGDRLDTSEWGTEKRAARVPLPEVIAAELMLDLSVPEPQGVR